MRSDRVLSRQQAVPLRIVSFRISSEGKAINFIGYIFQKRIFIMADVIHSPILLGRSFLISSKIVSTYIRSLRSKIDS